MFTLDGFPLTLYSITFNAGVGVVVGEGVGDGWLTLTTSLQLNNVNEINTTARCLILLSNES